MPQPATNILNAILPNPADLPGRAQGPEPRRRSTQGDALPPQTGRATPSRQDQPHAQARGARTGKPSDNFARTVREEMSRARPQDDPEAAAGQDAAPAEEPEPKPVAPAAALLQAAQIGADKAPHSPAAGGQHPVVGAGAAAPSSAGVTVEAPPAAIHAAETGTVELPQAPVPAAPAQQTATVAAEELLPRPGAGQHGRPGPTAGDTGVPTPATKTQLQDAPQPPVMQAEAPGEGPTDRAGLQTPVPNERQAAQGQAAETTTRADDAQPHRAGAAQRTPSGAPGHQTNSLPAHDGPEVQPAGPTDARQAIRAPRDLRVETDTGATTHTERIPGVAGPEPSSATTASPAPRAPQPTGGTMEASVGGQIADQLRGAPLRAERTVTIRLNPPELGRVRVSFHREGGELRAVVEADSARTLQELQRETPGLLQRLGDAGVSLRRVEVTLSQDGPSDGSGAQSQLRDGQGQAGPQDGGAGAESQRHAPRPVEEEPQPADAHPAPVPDADDGGVNVWI